MGLENSVKNASTLLNGHVKSLLTTTYGSFTSFPIEVNITDFMLLESESLNPDLSKEGGACVKDGLELSANMLGNWSKRGKKNASLKEGSE
jgi:hypothetical protein